MKGTTKEIDYSSSEHDDHASILTPLQIVSKRLREYSEDMSKVNSTTLNNLADLVDEINSAIEQEEKAEGEEDGGIFGMLSGDKMSTTSKESGGVGSGGMGTKGNIHLSPSTKELSRLHHKENYDFNLMHARDHLKEAEHSKMKMERDSKPGLSVSIGVHRIIPKSLSGIIHKGAK